MGKNYTIIDIYNSDFYKLYKFVTELENLAVLGNVWDLSLKAAKDALLSKKLYYIDSGEPITGDSLNECYAALFYYYGCIVNGPNLEQLSQQISDISNVKLELSMSGNLVDSLIIVSNAKNFDYSQRLGLFTNAQDYFLAKGYKLPLNDFDSPEFINSLYALAADRQGIVKQYFQAVYNFQHLADRVQVQNLHIIDSLLSDVNTKFGTQYTDSITLGAFDGLVRQMRDSSTLQN